MKLAPTTVQRPVDARLSATFRGLLSALILWCMVASGVARAEEAVGILKVTASVPEALVHIDNEVVGNTPVTRYLAPGSYIVRVSADGYDPFVRKVTVTANLSQTLGAELMAGGGNVEFAVKPGGAKVVVDDIEVGVAPIRLNTVPPGDHRYRITKEGYEPLEGVFTLVKGGNPLISATLESSQGRFSIVSTPPGAVVYLDGKSVGNTPLYLRDIPPGEHNVALYLAGHTLISRKVDTSDGSRGEVEATLTAPGATVEINTGHAEGLVFVDEIPVGSGRAVTLMIARGEHTIQAMVPDHKPAVLTLEVPISGELSYTAHVVPLTSPEESTIDTVVPLTRRWTFWAAVGGGAAGAAATATVLAIVLSPDPPPTGDIVVTLP